MLQDHHASKTETWKQSVQDGHSGLQLSSGKVVTTVSGIMSSYRLGYDGSSSYVSLTMPVKQTNNYKTYGLFFLSPLSVSRQQDPSGLTVASRNCVAS